MAGPLWSAKQNRCVFNGEQEAMCPQGRDTAACKYLENWVWCVHIKKKPTSFSLNDTVETPNCLQANMQAGQWPSVGWGRGDCRGEGGTVNFNQKSSIMWQRTWGRLALGNPRGVVTNKNCMETKVSCWDIKLLGEWFCQSSGIRDLCSCMKKQIYYS